MTREVENVKGDPKLIYESLCAVLTTAYADKVAQVYLISLDLLRRTVATFADKVDQLVLYAPLLPLLQTVVTYTVRQTKLMPSALHPQSNKRAVVALDRKWSFFLGVRFSMGGVALRASRKRRFGTSRSRPCCSLPASRVSARCVSIIPGGAHCLRSHSNSVVLTPPVAIAGADRGAGAGQEG